MAYIQNTQFHSLWFSDEIFFTVVPPMNLQNDREASVL